MQINDAKDSLEKFGAETFLRSNPHSVLVVLGLAGSFKGEFSLQKTILSQKTSAEAMAVTQLLGRIFPIAKAKFSPPGPVSLGRGPDTDIVVPESSISKRHCYFAMVGNEMRLTDCGSTNGLLVNDVKLDAKKPVALVGGEELILGRLKVLYLRPQGFIDYLLRGRP